MMSETKHTPKIVDLLDQINAGAFDSHYGKGLSAEYACAVSRAALAKARGET